MQIPGSTKNNHAEYIARVRNYNLGFQLQQKQNKLRRQLFEQNQKFQKQMIHELEQYITKSKNQPQQARDANKQIIKKVKQFYILLTSEKNILPIKILPSQFSHLQQLKKILDDKEMSYKQFFAELFNQFGQDYQLIISVDKICDVYSKIKMLKSLQKLTINVGVLLYMELANNLQSSDDNQQKMKQIVLGKYLQNEIQNLNYSNLEKKKDLKQIIELPKQGYKFQVAFKTQYFDEAYIKNNLNNKKFTAKNQPKPNSNSYKSRFEQIRQLLKKLTKNPTPQEYKQAINIKKLQNLIQLQIIYKQYKIQQQFHQNFEEDKDTKINLMESNAKIGIKKITYETNEIVNLFIKKIINSNLKINQEIQFQYYINEFTLNLHINKLTQKQINKKGIHYIGTSTEWGLFIPTLYLINSNPQNEYIFIANHLKFGTDIKMLIERCNCIIFISPEQFKTFDDIKDKMKNEINTSKYQESDKKVKKAEISNFFFHLKMTLAYFTVKQLRNQNQLQFILPQYKQIPPKILQIALMKDRVKSLKKDIKEFIQKYKKK